MRYELNIRYSNNQRLSLRGVPTGRDDESLKTKTDCFASLAMTNWGLLNDLKIWSLLTMQRKGYNITIKEQGSVLVITKGSIDDCNTKYAQGGIAAPIGRDDSPELHFKDTIAAGKGLCNEEAVRILVNEAPDRIAELVNFGVPFDTLDGEITLTREAAHSVSRILHAGGDATGEHIEVTLSNRIRSSKIQVLEDSLATEILVEKGTVRGIRVLDCRTGTVEELGCRFLILATGGAGQLFKFTTNSNVATGDGVALAFNAGVEITDMEFFQFHPTALYLPGVTPFLISEAVRGEGGILRNTEGYRFMLDYTQMVIWHQGI